MKAAYVNLKMSGDAGDGEILIKVDDVEVARTRLKSYVLDRLSHGLQKFQALAKNKDRKDVEASALKS